MFRKSNHPGEGQGPVGKAEVTERNAPQPPSPNWPPASAGVQNSNQNGSLNPAGSGSPCVIFAISCDDA